MRDVKPTIGTIKEFIVEASCSTSKWNIDHGPKNFRTQIELGPTRRGGELNLQNVKSRVNLI